MLAFNNPLKDFLIFQSDEEKQELAEHKDENVELEAEVVLVNKIDEVNDRIAYSDAQTYLRK